MGPWTGVVLPLTEPGSDELNSSLPAHLHPVAGRPLVWHTARAVASLHPAPERVVVVIEADGAADLFADLRVPVERRSPDDVAALQGWTLSVHAAAPCAAGAFQRALDAGEPARVVDARGCLVALLDDGGGSEPAPRSDPDASLVSSRSDLARVTAGIRDAIVLRLMEAGVTFHVPETVLVDVDVTIGRDTIVYPGVVLEGKTSIGAETVIGPPCRIINS